MEVLTNFKEIYRTQNGCVYQCDKKRCFGIDFGGYMTEYKLPCFFALKKLVENIDLDEMALDSSHASDIEIISPCGSERCYVLTLSELIEFKELLSGARVMLQLNSILHERLYRIAV
ncbi:MAG TPA: hypothetical protein VIQ51_10450 [Chryseosolibacter sp.]